MSRVLIHVQYLKGIGHLARAGLIAGALARRGHDAHIASGGLPVPHFAPEGVTVHQLPALSAGPGGFADLRDENGAAINAAWRAMRRERTLALFASLAPDALVIETFPFGRRALSFELMPLLERAHVRASRPAVLCSIRDILQENRKPGRAEETLARANSLFDAVLVHGDAGFAALEASFPAAARISDMLHYTGFVAGAMEAPAPGPGTPRGEVVVSAGGGAVGPALAMAAMEARPTTALAAAPWRILAGPNLPEEDFSRLKKMAEDGVAVDRFRRDFRTLLAASRLSISYAGYNTVCDLMRVRTPAVLVSYSGESGGESEQAARAARCEALGMAAALADRNVTAKSLGAAVARALALPPREGLPFDLGGAERSAELIARWTANAISGRSA